MLLKFNIPGNIIWCKTLPTQFYDLCNRNCFPVELSTPKIISFGLLIQFNTKTSACTWPFQLKWVLVELVEELIYVL